jgi:hypothetical protein
MQIIDMKKRSFGIQRRTGYFSDPKMAYRKNYEVIALWQM